MKKIGVFSGSFNPIHIGHLALANWLCEYEDIAEIWFLVTPQNPLKDRDDLINYPLRYEMVKKAIADYPRFKVSDFELSLPLPSYTIDTLHALQKTHPDHLFHLIIGSDSWESINLWKEAQTLMKEFSILIYPRKGYEQTISSPLSHIRKVEAPMLDISSTFIRTAIKQGKDIRFFLPEAIRKDINLLRNNI